MSLPLPETDAARHSHVLCRHIADTIDASGGWISFARYMELALHEPGLGYYGAGAHKFGASGDFVTAPEISPLFATTLATQVVEIMAASSPCIVEIGPGSGSLAAGLLQELETRGSLPERYLMIELSGELRWRQRETLEQRVPHLAGLVSWIEALPQRHSGVVLANELLDALPVHLVAWMDEGIFERGVTLGQDQALSWSDRPATGPLLSAAEALPVAAPYASEIGLAARAWIATWAQILDAGALLLVDYGFPRREFYHPQRNAGTLMCHYRHHAHGDPFHLPGLTDITSHIDFTALAEVGVEWGLDVCGYTSQAHFLLNCGITDALARTSQEDRVNYLRLAAGVQKLLSPSEMGELFKVIVMGRGMPETLVGFAGGDRRHRL